MNTTSLEGIELVREMVVRELADWIEGNSLLQQRPVELLSTPRDQESHSPAHEL